jgi:hypothetical protein
MIFVRKGWAVIKAKVSRLTGGAGAATEAAESRLEVGGNHMTTGEESAKREASLQKLSGPVVSFAKLAAEAIGGGSPTRSMTLSMRRPNRQV